MKEMVTAIRLLALLTLLTGVAYPAVMLLAGKTLFPAQASGSLLNRNGSVVGSALVAQKFTAPRYFQPRPSASDYWATPAGASNLSPTAKALLSAVAARRAVIDRDAGREMLFATGSGLDPEISRQSALAQIPRVMRARGIDSATLEGLVNKCTRHRAFGFLGEEGVNVLLLNLAVDELTRK